VDTLLLMLAPEAPHLAEELWQRRQGRGDFHPESGGDTFDAKESIHVQAWPVWDAELAKAATITLVVQVNGKVRDKIEAPADITEEDARLAALASPAVQRWLEGKSVHKVIFAGGKLVNVVAG
jgi:leucyl-tRNA synthetase